MAWMLLIAPTTLALFSLPLIARLVPPNPLYGFRTPKTLSDSAIWYEANRGAGWDMLVAAVAQLVLVWLRPSIDVLSAMKPGVFLLTTQMPTLGLAVAHSSWRLRKR